MPELPEVETVVRGLQKSITGKTIRRADVLTAKIRVDVTAGLAALIKGQVVERVSRRAKYILIHLGNSGLLVIHLGMSGRIRINDPRISAKKPRPGDEIIFEDNQAAQKHDHLKVTFTDDSSFVFNDPRRFGLVLYMTQDEFAEHPAFKSLGPEPLERKFTGRVLETAMAKRKTPVKTTIMDQRIVVGVGNIYASEALFRAGIDPRKPANEIRSDAADLLCRSIKDVLNASIKSGGSTLKDYRTAEGGLGYFQHQFAVYNREGEACANCTCDVKKTGGVLKITQAGRSSFYCPRKQR